MQPAEFDYHRPADLAEALELLSRLDDARPLAGGQSLLPAMKMRLSRPAALVDLGRISELSGIRRDGDALVLGATTRYTAVMESAEVSEACPVLQECVGVVGDRQVRHVGTVGGSVAHADPAADLPTLLVALDATVLARGPDGEREIPAREFFTGLFATALQPGELVTALRVPATGKGTGAAYLKHPHPASRYAVVGVAATLTVEDGAVSEAAVAVGGVTGHPVLAEEAGDSLVGGSPEPDALAEAAERVAGALADPIGDTYASGEYRVHLATVLTRRTLTRAADRSG